MAFHLSGIGKGPWKTESARRPREYVLVPDPTYIENQILDGTAILVDVGEDKLMYAVPKGL
jgi:hypothetical protein